MLLRVLQFVLGAGLAGGGGFLAWTHRETAANLFPPGPAGLPYLFLLGILGLSAGIVFLVSAVHPRPNTRRAAAEKAAREDAALGKAEAYYSERARAADRTWRDDDISPPAAAPSSVAARAPQPAPAAVEPPQPLAIAPLMPAAPPPKPALAPHPPTPATAPPPGPAPGPAPVQPPPAPPVAATPLQPAPPPKPVTAPPQPAMMAPTPPPAPAAVQPPAAPPPAPAPAPVPPPPKPVAAPSPAAAPAAAAPPPPMAPAQKPAVAPPPAPPASAPAATPPAAPPVRQSGPPAAPPANPFPSPITLAPIPRGPSAGPPAAPPSVPPPQPAASGPHPAIRSALAAGNLAEAEGLLNAARETATGADLAYLTALAGDHAAAAGQQSHAKWLWRLALRRLTEAGAADSPDAKRIAAALAPQR